LTPLYLAAIQALYAAYQVLRTSPSPTWAASAMEAMLANNHARSKFHETILSTGEKFRVHISSPMLKAPLCYYTPHHASAASDPFKNARVLSIHLQLYAIRRHSLRHLRAISEYAPDTCGNNPLLSSHEPMGADCRTDNAQFFVEQRRPKLIDTMSILSAA